MAERTFIPSSPACGQWETLLAEALDGLLQPGDEATFSAHMAVCPACTALFEEARQGREWLQFLLPEPEVPAGLLEKILAQTGPGQIEGYGLSVEGGDVLPMPSRTIPNSTPAWHRPGFMGFVRRFAEPRLMMTAAMAFFSIALTINMTGVKLTSLKLSDLRPSALRSLVERRLTMASTPIIRYYDHLRLVYEVQTRVRELRRTTEGGGQDNSQEPKDNQPSAPGESKQTPGHKDGGTRVYPPQESVNPAINDVLDSYESSLTIQERPAHSGGSAEELWERSTIWTA